MPTLPTLSKDKEGNWIIQLPSEPLVASKGKGNLIVLNTGGYKPVSFNGKVIQLNITGYLPGTAGISPDEVKL